VGTSSLLPTDVILPHRFSYFNAFRKEKVTFGKIDLSPYNDKPGFLINANTKSGEHET
jgi:hypothetical protein